MAKAFTTIEMIAATGLAVLLMVGVLRVTSAIQSKSIAGPRDDDAWLGRLVHLVTWDLTHAQTIHWDQGQLVMEGFGCLESVEGKTEQTHRPVRVRYQLVGQAGDAPIGRWLIRRQTRLDVLTNRHVSSRLLAGGITSFALLPEDDQALMEALDGNQMQEPEAPPNRFRIMLHWVDPDNLTHEWERVVVVR